MSTRSPSPRMIGGLLVALTASAISSIAAQPQSPLRPGQTPGPRFVMSAMKGEGDGPRLGFQVANAVRERIASDFEMRALWVVPESTITNYLIQGGYPADQALSSTDEQQLARSFSAAELLNGIVTKTTTGYRVQAMWALSGRDDMVQPLPAVEAAKVSDVAKLVAREFQSARKQVESVQRCLNLARARNYAGAIAEARKAIDAYPKSVLGRVCIANIYVQQKAGPDSMLAIAEEILSVHPENARALALAADAYGELKGVDDQIRTLERLLRVEPTNRPARRALVEVRAQREEIESAKAHVDTLVAQQPDDSAAVSLQWRVYLRAKDWARAVGVGERLIEVDTVAATHDFFVRIIGAAEAAQDLPKALDLANRAVGRFPNDDELALIRIKFLRLAGQLPQALASVNTVIARNPKAPNAWLQKARIEFDLKLGVDTVLATLGRGLQNGEDRADVAAMARGLGGVVGADSVPNKIDALRTALRYYKLSASAQANDTTSYRIGSTSVQLAQRLTNDPAALKQCTTAKELEDLSVDALIELPKGARVVPPEVIPRLMAFANQLSSYAEQLVKAVCPRKD